MATANLYEKPTFYEKIFHLSYIQFKPLRSIQAFTIKIKEKFTSRFVKYRFQTTLRKHKHSNIKISTQVFTGHKNVLKTLQFNKALCRSFNQLGWKVLFLCCSLKRCSYGPRRIANKIKRSSPLTTARVFSVTSTRRDDTNKCSSGAHFQWNELIHIDDSYREMLAAFSEL